MGEAESCVAHPIFLLVTPQRLDPSVLLLP